MRFLITMLVLFLSFPAIAGFDDCRKLFELWKADKAEEIARTLEAEFEASECRVGGVPGNPERTDAPYLSWKKYMSEVVLAREFTSDLRELKEKYPEVWRNIGSFPEADAWASGFYKDIGIGVVTYKGSLTRITDGPPPEGWTSCGMDSQGRAVDSSGELTTGSPDWFTYFWIPAILATIVGAWIQCKADCGGGLAFAAIVVLYGYATDPWQVFYCFVSLYVVFILLVWFAFKLVVSGLGFGGSKS